MELFKITLWVLGSIYAAVYLLVFHRLLKNWLPYKWVIESVMYRIHLRRIKRLSHDEKTRLYTDWIIYDWWHQECWFGRSAKRYLEKHINKTELN